MTIYLIVAIGMAIWIAVFIFLIIALTVEADVTRRWDEQWAISWEQRTGRPVDDLLDRLAGQIRGWQTARRLAFFYLFICVVAVGILAGVQYFMPILSPDGFQKMMLLGGVMLVLLFIPLMATCEVGLNLVEAMRRQLRQALGEKVVINAKQEIRAIPKPKKEKKKSEGK